MAKNASLSHFSETTLDFKATPSFPVGCPTLDLCAAWNGEDKSLYIYRPRNQIVSKIHQASFAGSASPDALTVTWKPDGQFLAVGWSDGAVRLMGLENNKTVHHIKVCDALSSARITHIGWATSALVEKSTKTVSERLKHIDPDAQYGLLDLPGELTLMEIETALPKISPLPSGSAGAGEDGTVFTLRSGIDFLFQSPKKSTFGQVSVMTVGTDDGQLHLTIYDSFVLGTLPCPSLNPERQLFMTYHAWNSCVSTQALLLADDEHVREDLYLVPMDLPFLSSSPINLSLLASKLTTMQTLLRYFKQTHLHMQVEWKNTRELPRRFLNSIQGDLQAMESGPRDIIAALYHTALTGHVYAPVKEWLMDTIAERGHKRWDKAVVSGLQNLQSLVHENFLPSLDKASVILSRLRGFAQFHDDRDDIGFSVAQINRLMDIMSCLSLIGHKILLQVMDELEHFNAFSSWLRFQIDRLGSSATIMEELTEKEATMSTTKVLTYIERYLVGNSPLDSFFDEISKEDYNSDWQNIEDRPNLLQVLHKELQKQVNRQPSMKALPHVEFLVNYATTWSNRIFNGVAEAKKRSIRFGTHMKLSIGAPIATLDMKMAEMSSKEHITIYIIIASKKLPGKVYIFQAILRVVNGISSNQSLKCSCLDLGHRSIIDLKLLNSDTLFILSSKQQSQEAELLSVPIQCEQVVYTTLTEENAASTPSIGIETIPSATYELPNDMNLRNIKLEVQAACDVRGKMPSRVSLLASNRVTWTSLVLP